MPTRLQILPSVLCLAVYYISVSALSSHANSYYILGNPHQAWRHCSLRGCRSAIVFKMHCKQRKIEGRKSLITA